MKLEDIESEYRGAVLGDKRRSKRLERIALELARNPGLSFPEAMESEGQLGGAVPLLEQRRGHLRGGAPPHAEQTRLRCQAHDEVLVLHDTTVLKFNGDREGLGRIHDAG